MHTDGQDKRTKGRADGIKWHAITPALAAASTARGRHQHVVVNTYAVRSSGTEWPDRCELSVPPEAELPTDPRFTVPGRTTGKLPTRRMGLDRAEYSHT